MYPCVPLVPLPAVAVGVFLCPVCLWHWQDAAGVIHVMHWCVQSWGDTPHPFWEALTLNTKGLDCLSSAAPTSYSNRIDTDPETRSLQSILPHYFVRVLKCGQVRLHPCRTLLFSNPAGLTSSDKWCDGKEIRENRKWVRPVCLKLFNIKDPKIDTNYITTQGPPSNKDLAFITESVWKPSFPYLLETPRNPLNDPTVRTVGIDAHSIFTKIDLLLDFWVFMFAIREEHLHGFENSYENIQ